MRGEGVTSPHTETVTQDLAVPTPSHRVPDWIGRAGQRIGWVHQTERNKARSSRGVCFLQPRQHPAPTGPSLHREARRHHPVSTDPSTHTTDHPALQSPSCSGPGIRTESPRPGAQLAANAEMALGVPPQAAPGLQVNDRTCIRCYCCHEFCPEQAIDLKPGRFAWLFKPLERL